MSDLLAPDRHLLENFVGPWVNNLLPNPGRPTLIPWSSITIAFFGYIDLSTQVIIILEFCVKMKTRG